jgi:hypothetical protein
MEYLHNISCGILIFRDTFLFQTLTRDQAICLFISGFPTRRNMLEGACMFLARQRTSYGIEHEIRITSSTV